MRESRPSDFWDARGENHQDALDRGRWHYVPAGRGRRRREPRRKGPKPRPLLERFWPKVDQFGPEPPHDPSLGRCWIWIGSIHRASGYGIFFMPGYGRDSGRSKRRAHRVSYELLVGAIPSGLDVLHRCDVRRCVNPAHLYLGTDADNMRDRDTRGRRQPPVGEANGRSKLTAAQAAEIRERYTGAWGEQTRLAREYGVNQTTISGIVRGVKWKA